MLKVAVFVSGRGSNLRAILDSQKLQDLISVTAVISNKIDCPAFEIAREYSINTYYLGKAEGAVQYSVLAKLLESLDIGLIVLAGFLKMIPADVIDVFRNRIINIHPALLPAFGGKGMYGMNVHRAVFNSTAKVSGATVHFVNEVYDDGEIIVQRKVDISDLTSPEQIAERVLKVEHELLPDVIEQFALNKISSDNARIEILN
ncbi:MAG: phosphoribosylglycinamide formyltransferase [Ignavibacterium sp.]|nr:MAG: phosphoribosylglycinamide formyltransferase [Ignavibacterium sp.]